MHQTSKLLNYGGRYQDSGRRQKLQSLKQESKSTKRVKVIYFGSLQKLTGRHEEKLDFPIGSTVRDLLGFLMQGYEKINKLGFLKANGELSLSVKVMVNDCDIDDIDGLDTKLEDNSEVCIMFGVLLLPGG